MKKILTAAAIIAVLVSCQKELSFDDGNPGNTGGTGTGNGNGSTDGMLWKAVAVTGAETITTIYTYDSQKKLETMTTAGTSGGMSMDTYNKYERDASGRIVTMKQKAADIMGIPSDTSVRTYHYPNSTTLDFDYSIQTVGMNVGGFPMVTTDSAVYHYTAGKMTSYDSYMSSSLMPGSIMSRSRTDFTYDASNRVTGMKIYNDASNPGGALTLFADYTYTYASTTVNHVYSTASGAQNYALNGLPNTGTHVITTMRTVSTNPPVDLTITTSFVNGAGNKPVSGTVVATEVGRPAQTTKYTFFYK